MSRIDYFTKLAFLTYLTLQLFHGKVLSSLQNDCLDCICEVETGCANIPCHMDEGNLSCGYFRIMHDQYVDCFEPGKQHNESSEVAFKRCAGDLECSKKCLEKYAQRYASSCKKKECEAIARIHHGGSDACEAEDTATYWKSVQKCLKRKQDTNKTECESGWEKFHGNCYKLIEGPGNDFYTAQNACVGIGGDSGSVHSEEENDYLIGIAKKHKEKKIEQKEGNILAFWLGLHMERDSSGKIVKVTWTDGTKVDYGNPMQLLRGQKPWATNPSPEYAQPDNWQKSDEDCVGLLPTPYHDPPNTFPHVGWYDYNCKGISKNFLMGAICKKSPSISSTPNTAIESKTVKPNKGSFTKPLLFILFGALLICLIIFVICTVVYRRRLLWSQRVDEFRRQWSMARKTKSDNGEEREVPSKTHRRVALVEPNSAKLTELEPNDYWELSWDKIKLMDEKLGSGAYGVVYRGVLTETPPSEAYLCKRALLEQSQNVRYDVAVKMLHKYASMKTREEFLREIDVMKTIGYQEHIVNMVGCITKGSAICMIQEYCANRDLLTYVQKLRNGVNLAEASEEAKMALAKSFLGFLWQIADGMRFLVSKQIIHRDLAARNVLLDKKNTAKISDFGLSIVNTHQKLNKSVSSTTSITNNFAETSLIRLSAEDEQNRQKQPTTSGRLPIKWLAIESLKQRMFSEKSDVWSFGVLIYEVYSFGKVPFEDVKPHLMLAHLEDGNRLERPELCSEEIHQIMQQSCLEIPDDRPTFNELVTSLTVLLEKATENYGYLPLAEQPLEANAKNVQIE